MSEPSRKLHLTPAAQGSKEVTEVAAAVARWGFCCGESGREAGPARACGPGRERCDLQSDSFIPGFSNPPKRSKRGLPRWDHDLIARAARKRASWVD